MDKARRSDRSHTPVRGDLGGVGFPHAEGPRHERLVSTATSLLELAGLASIVVGAGMVFAPLWFILGGCAALAIAWGLSR